MPGRAAWPCADRTDGGTLGTDPRGREEIAQALSVLEGRLLRPAGPGAFGRHPFGGEVTGWRAFDGVAIPSAGRVGWFFGTDRWPGGEFFRYRITGLELVTAVGR